MLIVHIPFSSQCFRYTHHIKMYRLSQIWKITFYVYIFISSSVSMSMFSFYWSSVYFYLTESLTFFGQIGQVPVRLFQQATSLRQLIFGSHTNVIIFIFWMRWSIFESTVLSKSEFNRNPQYCIVYVYT